MPACRFGSDGIYALQVRHLFPEILHSRFETLDLRTGGKYSYVWRHANKSEMGMGGAFGEVVSAERLVATEAFDEPWYPGEAVSTITLVERSGRTTMTNTILYESRTTRDGVLKSPMESGVAVSYDRLEKLLATSA